MKKLRKTIALVVVIAVFLTSLVFINASADEPITNFEGNTIYYFTDCYPTLDYYQLSYAYSTYNLVYERRFVTSQIFDQLVEDGYFSNLGEGYVAIFDIKGFVPDTETLNTLFDDLKNEQGCTTALFTIADEDDFEAAAFLDNVDVLVEGIVLKRLQRFFEASFDKLNEENGYIGDIVFLVDGNTFNPSMTGQVSIAQITDISPYIRVLIAELMGWQLDENLKLSNGNKATLVSDLNSMNVRILVHNNSTSRFTDIRFWENYTYTGVSSLKTVQVNPNETYTYPNICAYGIWEINSQYYSVLMHNQQSMLDVIPKHFMVVDPIVTSEDGLEFLDESALESTWLPETDPDAPRAIEALSEFL